MRRDENKFVRRVWSVQNRFRIANMNGFCVIIRNAAEPVSVNSDDSIQNQCGEVSELFRRCQARARVALTVPSS